MHFMIASLWLAGCGTAELPPPVAGRDEAAKEELAETEADEAAEDLVPRGLPGMPKDPADNASSPEKVALGHELFLDPRLSGDGSRSCYSCHLNDRGLADGRVLALGAGDKPLTRNTPTMWNVGYAKAWYWDGRADSLEAQAIGALKGGNMGVGADKLDAKAAEIGALPEYAARFKSVFGMAEADTVTPDHVAKALSAYERTLLCGDPESLDEAATRGQGVFLGKGRCVACHTPPLYSDGLYHDIGLGGDDVGRGKVTKVDDDMHRFRTPSLRNVAQTAPYFHDGSAPDLDTAVRRMARVQLAYTLEDSEADALVAFLGSLTGTWEGQPLAPALAP